MSSHHFHPSTDWNPEALLESENAHETARTELWEQGAGLQGGLVGQIRACEPMMIINADDFGRSVAETDTAAALVQRGRVTSLSAMVFMDDSERAADIAQDLDADVGLHLNFCERWMSRNVPSSLRHHHDSLVRFFDRGRYAVLFYDPRLRRSFDAVYQAEVDEFRRLYGRPPSHIDGHRHLHLCANMLIDRVIPAGTRVRRNFTFTHGEKGVFNRAYRRVVDTLLGRRYTLTDYFFSLQQSLSGRGRPLREVAELAKTASVEVMTHPRNPNEFLCLDGQRYKDALESVRLGKYAARAVNWGNPVDKAMIWGLLAGLCECSLL